MPLVVCMALPILHGIAHTAWVCQTCGPQMVQLHSCFHGKKLLLSSVLYVRWCNVCTRSLLLRQMYALTRWHACPAIYSGVHGDVGSTLFIRGWVCAFVPIPFALIEAQRWLCCVCLCVCVFTVLVPVWGLAQILIIALVMARNVLDVAFRVETRRIAKTK